MAGVHQPLAAKWRGAALEPVCLRRRPVPFWERDEPLLPSSPRSLVRCIPCPRARRSRLDAHVRRRPRDVRTPCLLGIVVRRGPHRRNRLDGEQLHARVACSGAFRRRCLDAPAGDSAHRDRDPSALWACRDLPRFGPGAPRSRGRGVVCRGCDGRRRRIRDRASLLRGICARHLQSDARAAGAIGSFCAPSVCSRSPSYLPPLSRRWCSYPPWI